RRHTRSKRDWSSDVCSSDLSFVNICVIKQFFLSKKIKSVKRILTNFVFPSIGLVFVVYLWINLNLFSLMLGAAWTLLGVIYLVFSTNFFTSSPPQIEFEELEM